MLILRSTNFYADAGGQIGDQGFINGANAEFHVKNTTVRAGYVCHVGVVVEGSFSVGEEVVLHLDGGRRKDIMGNHTGTHLLNFALRVSF